MKNLPIFIILLIFLQSCTSGGRQKKITRLAQLHDKRINVITGTAADVVTRKNFPKAEIKNFYSTTDATYNVSLGKSDAFIFDKVVLQNIVKKYHDLKLLNEVIDTAQIAVAFNPNNTEMLKQVNRAIQQLEKNGILDSMKKKWLFTDYDTIPQLPEIQYISSKQTLKVGICAQFPPMMFVANNSFTGFDMELILRLGELLGKRIETVDMSFDSLILALESRKIDFAVSNFEITQDRKKFVNFSTPYLVQEISALVKN